MFSVPINQNYEIIPIGFRCSSAIACKLSNIRKFSLPFDWCIIESPLQIKNVIENNFKNYIPIQNPDFPNTNLTNQYSKY